MEKGNSLCNKLWVRKQFMIENNLVVFFMLVLNNEDDLIELKDEYVDRKVRESTIFREC